MVRLNVKPTRMELNNLKERLKTAERGHKLLKDKRDELMRRFISLIRENNQLRKEVESYLIDNLKAFAVAKSLKNSLMVEELFSIPSKEIELFVEKENIMSVTVPRMHMNITSQNENSEYSYLSSNSEMDDVFATMNSLIDKLLRLAEVEKTCQLMADEIEKTRRRVNGLEYSIIPNLSETIHYIELKLEEAERANLVRIMKVK
ncbi:TPA: V-type ATP synthase subunit D [Streptococcus pneumoniae]|mgnify:FL=1|uniref:V-type ATP synthase subunit D n=13 Tax=Streptococcus pneumoniae TaxID=1313 RepID=VATD_STRPI|nr:V-type ATP synthase subunit D [Streptococcus pneumoniae]B1ICC7.1 RecName: Full=V-type ATP synthase subunit D; AltName: Full=V-ATPase subunit D [Streptococcus pneumoniae Hungary19A-6]EDK62190.1 ATP synthase subunit D [Streptococcus pneumoniae SP11-BS70]EGJ15848.1 V-type ATPase, D subunit [Streptococcus pneumoniae GA47368]EHD60388.1 V-type ATPase, D subunit [Streptococcus pneumoniae GA41410]EHD63453.1 V-type ATPase, D subunit [Streptococcus pneumoniae GA41538]EHE14622.1 V-type ATPase, D subu